MPRCAGALPEAATATLKCIAPGQKKLLPSSLERAEAAFSGGGRGRKWQTGSVGLGYTGEDDSLARCWSGQCAGYPFDYFSISNSERSVARSLETPTYRQGTVLSRWLSMQCPLFGRKEVVEVLIIYSMSFIRWKKMMAVVVIH